MRYPVNYENRPARTADKKAAPRFSDPRQQMLFEEYTLYVRMGWSKEAALRIASETVSRCLPQQ